MTRNVGDWTFTATEKSDECHGSYIKVECFIRKMDGSKSNWKDILFYGIGKTARLIDYINKSAKMHDIVTND